MKYTVTLTYEVEGDCSPQEALSSAISVIGRLDNGPIAQASLYGRTKDESGTYPTVKVTSTKIDVTNA